MDRVCKGCGKEYWFKQAWMHEKCVVVHKPDGSSQDGSSRHGKYADLEKRKAYRRQWMRNKRNGQDQESRQVRPQAQAC